MINSIKKYKVIILFSISFVILSVSIVIAQFSPLNEKVSSIITLFLFDTAMLAMIFNENDKNNKYTKSRIFALIVVKHIQKNNKSVC
ncbi:hypothetical protein [Clostridium frigidicarnis]|uniref:Uncharacterized protein n=1 Tax=Clostridium frigidicarnis TaxID=84698 RepID=A0A1I0X6K8_9CLOT|nr:hypothetical protein [Clostridium frigidicarnis]SFA96561.1 hypothetical protein SAMN04488528_1007108 [Clostridium frigidicarnis]